MECLRLTKKYKISPDDPRRQPGWNPNPKGKGGLQERPEDINYGGKTSEQKRLEMENAKMALEAQNRFLRALQATLSEMASDKVIDSLNRDKLSLIEAAMDRAWGKAKNSMDLSSSDGSMKPTTIQLVAPSDDNGKD